jgi:PTS system nitrogen regulatory IIA component
LDNIDSLVGVLGRSVTGLEFDSIDGKPTHLVFMLVAPSNSTGIHLKALARLSRLFRDALFRQRLLDAPDAASMYRIIEEEDAKY